MFANLGTGIRVTLASGTLDTHSRSTVPCACARLDMHAERTALETFQKRRRVNPPRGKTVQYVCTVSWKASTIDIVRFDGFVELVMIASAGMHGMNNTRTQYMCMQRALYIRGLTTIISLG